MFAPLLLVYFVFSVCSLSTVTFENARFSFPTPRMVRLEWSPSRTFEDRPSLTFINRQLPDISLNYTIISDTIHIITESNPGIQELAITYKAGKGEFSCANLEIIVLNAFGFPDFITWCPELNNNGLFKGSVETTDCYDGADNCYNFYIQRLQPSVLSKSGWTFINDTSPVLTSTWRGSRITGNSDFYFMGYGLDYQQGLYDFTQAAGPIYLMPARAYGNWWSRYWPYNETGIQDVIVNYENRGIPLNMLVLDINWHNSGPATQGCGPNIGYSACSQGYGGYSWNRTLFSDPQSFQQWVHNRDLQLMLNIHDQCGIDHCQASYPQAAALVGIDPSTNQPIVCKYTDENYSKALFEYELGQPDNQNVDFWWEDYGIDMGPYAFKDLNCVDAHCMRCLNDTEDGFPILWSAHLHVKQRTQNNLRGMVLGIYGGLGSHRYPIVGSGDTYAAWETLAFEIAMTVSAGNVATGWTHDLGGFMGPVMRDPELFLRWLQFGIYSYLFRTHCSFCEIRIWEYPNYEDMRQTFLIRNSLLPYIYTSAWTSYTKSRMLVTPLYFEWPTLAESYSYNGTEYMFGPNLLVAPITNAVNPSTNTTEKTIWIPPGNWINWKTGKNYVGPMEITEVFGLTDIPVYAQAGSIVPMKQPTIHGTVANPIIFTIFYSTETSSTGAFYEDDGETLNYTMSDAYWYSELTQFSSNQITYLFYNHISGSGFPGQLTSRAYEFQLRGVTSSQFSITCNGTPIPQNNNQQAPGWWLIQDNSVSVLVVSIGTFPLSSQLSLQITHQ